MLYELTITLNPKEYVNPTYIQFSKTAQILQRLYAKREIRNISIVAEVTKTCNIHYHCLVDLKDLDEKREILDVLRKCLCFGKKSCDQVRNEPLYRSYMLKALQDTHTCVNQCPIICDDHGVFKDIVCPCNQKVCTYKLLVQYDITKLIKCPKKSKLFKEIVEDKLFHK